MCSMTVTSDKRKFVRHNLYRCVLIKGEPVICSLTSIDILDCYLLNVGFRTDGPHPLNMLGLNLGVDFKNPALRLPFVWLIGFDNPGNSEL